MVMTQLIISQRQDMRRRDSAKIQASHVVLGSVISEVA
jgi:hypothetical protein